LAIFAVVVAAGQGARFGGDTPKQFLMLHDRPVIAHTLHRFEECRLVEKVVIVAAPAWLTYLSHEIVDRFRFKKCDHLVPGGESRQDSVWSGLRALPARISDVVVVHDAVRPLFSLELLERVVARCEKFDGCIPALSLSDTVKQISGEVITATLDRERLKLAQTPQAFRSGILTRAFEQAQRDRFQGTDEAALVERSGGRTCRIEGEASNLKITTPSDLELAAFFLRQHEARSPA
jgi:2-C-methyl-D-erythritol 4-phosphate cytidylyltransferase